MTTGQDHGNGAHAFKVVLYGPTSVGKSTNLDQLKLASAPEHCGDLVRVDNTNHCTLSLNLRPVGPLKSGLTLYTLSGPHNKRSSWTELMQGVHGVIFVADSHNERFAENVNSMHDLVEDLAYHKLKLENFPCVLQYNKRDLEQARLLDKLEQELNPLGLPFFEACARDGLGVVACLRAINYLIEKSQT